ncbi:MAG: Elongation factor 4 [Parcubacteria group bacterium GW2011_GWC2_39_11]|nr:MAG: Elongation factor 4 [Parcubacteria group bacterium GW2011_GWC2_39_11]
MGIMEIRNFSIIAHIDHGKSTLADRFLEMTGAVSPQKMKPQFLDRMELEKEKGITIKLKPVRMEYRADDSKEYILNLVDTPGHVDFSYEVSRSLAAVEGTILLVDATKGIQAQTLANLSLANQQGLVVIPVVNKIDSPQAETEKTTEELAMLIGCDKEDIIKISAKQGTGVKELLEIAIKKVPCPKTDFEKQFRALIFDSEYDAFKGVIAYIRVIDGEINEGEEIELMASGAKTQIKELGYFTPDFSSQKKLSAGETGYIATGIKEPGKVRVGDTIILSSKFQALNSKIEPLAGYKEPVPVVFASLYPEDPDDFDLFKDSLAKLRLSDPSFIFEPETKEALGRGFRCGFLGALHAEIVSERIHREFGIDLVISSPSVVFKIITQKDKEITIYSATEWPDVSQIKEAKEPWVNLEVMSLIRYMGGLLDLFKNIGAKYIETRYFGQEKIILVYELPLRQVITNLYEKIKNISQGYGSMNYKILEFRKDNLVKLEILVAGEKKEAFSKIIPESEAFREGKFLVEKLKSVLPPEQFSVALQAAVGSKIIARETISARRKDVTGYLYGGDYSRKRKLLEKQKKGKKLLRDAGKVRIPANVFLEIFRS